MCVACLLRIGGSSNPSFLGTLVYTVSAFVWAIVCIGQFFVNRVVQPQSVSYIVQHILKELGSYASRFRFIWRMHTRKTTFNANYTVLFTHVYNVIVLLSGTSCLVRCSVVQIKASVAVQHILPLYKTAIKTKTVYLMHHLPSHDRWANDAHRSYR